MGRAKLNRKRIHVYIAESTLDRLAILLHDPFRGKNQFGALTNIVNVALTEYCDKHLEAGADIKRLLDEINQMNGDQND